MKNDHIVLSLGGSILAPEAIDGVFARRFSELIKESTIGVNSKKFVIIVGGGKIARLYHKGLDEAGFATSTDLDQMGIYTTRTNAQFLRLVMSDIADEQLISNPDEIANSNKPVILGGGWKPGASSDYVATRVAVTMGISTVVNLSNISYVYTDDPKNNPKAERISETNWENYLKLIPNEWNPGLNTPFDPIASKHAWEHNLDVVIMDGRNLTNFKDYLDGKEFQGTRIHP